MVLEFFLTVAGIFVGAIAIYLAIFKISTKIKGDKK